MLHDTTSRYFDNIMRKLARVQGVGAGPKGTGVQDDAIARKLVATLEGVARYELVLYEYRQCMKSRRQQSATLTSAASTSTSTGLAQTFDPSEEESGTVDLQGSSEQKSGSSSSSLLSAAQASSLSVDRLPDDLKLLRSLLEERERVLTRMQHGVTKSQHALMSSAQSGGETSKGKKREILKATLNGKYDKDDEREHRCWADFHVGGGTCCSPAEV